MKTERNVKQPKSRFARATAGVLAGLTFAFALFTARDAGAVIVRTAVAYRPVHPVARAAAVGAAAAVTAVAVGTVVRSLPPHCTATRVGNVVYQNCGGTFYQPQYSGSQVTYVVVNPPR